MPKRINVCGCYHNITINFTVPHNTLFCPLTLNNSVLFQTVQVLFQPACDRYDVSLENTLFFINKITPSIAKLKQTVRAIGKSKFADETFTKIKSVGEIFEHTYIYIMVIIYTKYIY